MGKKGNREGQKKRREKASQEQMDRRRMEGNKGIEAKEREREAKQLYIASQPHTLAVAR